MDLGTLMIRKVSLEHSSNLISLALGCVSGLLCAVPPWMLPDGVLWNSLTAACQGNSFGPGCRNTCHCHNGALCHHVTGTCLCSPGWKGATCQEGRVENSKPCLWIIGGKNKTCVWGKLTGVLTLSSLPGVVIGFVSAVT